MPSSVQSAFQGISRRSGLRSKALLAVLAGLAFGALAPAHALAVTLGVGGISPEGLRSPLFLALGVREARVGVAWNAAVSRDPTARRRFAAWLDAAQTAGVTPLVSFSREGIAPDSARYGRAVKAFIRMFPQVRRYTAWNEPDWRSGPVARHPQLAAAYFNVLRAACRGCIVLAGDVFLPAEQLKPWLARYVKALDGAPIGWALHNYRDVREHSTKQLRVLMSLTRGPIWLDETAGVLRRGRWRTQSRGAAAGDERFLLSLARRYPRITRVYHYEWQTAPTDTWDSALINANGTPRPAYHVLAAAAGAR
jgi:hypothetical protein